jgi:ABC-2 type transport system ATP-binding protein
MNDPLSMNIVEASGLGKRYGGMWALRECTLAIPAGHVTALVGPNGAGKTTLLNLAVGLTAPSAGAVTVLGGRPAGSPAALDGIAFVAQDTPVYKNLSAGDMLHLTRNLTRRFDQRYAQARLAELGIPLNRKAGRLSGGQRAQLALTLALARRPRLLVLDEPVASLDPVARHDFMATVSAAAGKGAAETGGISVLLSSHVLTELERVTGYLILLSRGRVQLAGEVAGLLATHRLLIGPAAGGFAGWPVVHASRDGGRARLLVRAGAADPVPPGWQAYPVSLEELALAYLREPGAALSAERRTRGPQPAEVTTWPR